MKKKIIASKSTSGSDIKKYNTSQSVGNKAVCQMLEKEIRKHLPGTESKIWHRSPVWFIEGNPIVGYNVQKKGVQLLFWSGMSFDEPLLTPVGNTEKFKTGGIMYTNTKEINTKDLARWLKKSKKIQWDYKNIVKRRGVLVRLK